MEEFGWHWSINHLKVGSEQVNKKRELSTVRYCVAPFASNEWCKLFSFGSIRNSNKFAAVLRKKSVGATGYERLIKYEARISKCTFVYLVFRKACHLRSSPFIRSVCMCCYNTQLALSLIEERVIDSNFCPKLSGSFSIFSTGTKGLRVRRTNRY